MNVPELLATAIAEVETGGAQRRGKSGEFGAFQYRPGTWKIIAGQYMKAHGITEPVLQSAKNEWIVSVWKIGELLKQWGPEDVALIWNVSLGGTEKPRRIKGVNRYGAAYDSAAYAKKVLSVFYRLIEGV